MDTKDVSNINKNQRRLNLGKYCAGDRDPLLKSLSKDVGRRNSNFGTGSVPFNDAVHGLGRRMKKVLKIGSDRVSRMSAQANSAVISWGFVFASYEASGGDA